MRIKSRRMRSSALGIPVDEDICPPCASIRGSKANNLWIDGSFSRRRQRPWPAHLPRVRGKYGVAHSHCRRSVAARSSRLGVWLRRLRPERGWHCSAASRDQPNSQSGLRRQRKQDHSDLDRLRGRRRVPASAWRGGGHPRTDSRQHHPDDVYRLSRDRAVEGRNDIRLSSEGDYLRRHTWQWVQSSQSDDAAGGS